MLEGLRSQIYQFADLEAAKVWYTALLGKPPYFDEPFYVGFNVGGYELGLQPSDNPDAEQAREAVAYWGVPDAEAAYAHLLASGATEHQPVQDVGGGIKLGAELDPMEVLSPTTAADDRSWNVHYRRMTEAGTSTTGGWKH